MNFQRAQYFFIGNVIGIIVLIIGIIVTAPQKKKEDEAKLAAAIPKVAAVIAIKEVKHGTTFDTTLVKAEMIDQNRLPAHAAASMKDVVGQVASKDIAANDVITSDCFQAKESDKKSGADEKGKTSSTEEGDKSGGKQEVRKP